MKKAMLVMAMALMGAMQVSAQSVKVDDKELIGTWVMESMQWEGEKKTMCGKESGYSQFKYYGADGEYACAELALTKEGKVVVMPHEYGTYSFKDGWYSEMGRFFEWKAIASLPLSLIRTLYSATRYSSSVMAS